MTLGPGIEECTGVCQEDQGKSDSGRKKEHGSHVRTEAVCVSSERESRVELEKEPWGGEAQRSPVGCDEVVGGSGGWESG